MIAAGLVTQLGSLLVLMAMERKARGNQVTTHLKRPRPDLCKATIALILSSLAVPCN